MSHNHLLKDAGVSIHVIATGAGAGLQQTLWATPGSSTYLSGATFPYAQEEQDELLGFSPEHYCSREASIDLASAAYMKAYRFGGKKPVGVGITATVASEKKHRGDHRVHVSVMTDEKVLSLDYLLTKGVGEHQRYLDGKTCDLAGYLITLASLDLLSSGLELSYDDTSSEAKERFFERPYFTANGKRLTKLSTSRGLLGPVHHALMPGAYNPPHEGHMGMADRFEQIHPARVVFNITTNPPHKNELTVQECLQRAKMLNGRDRLFTQNDPLYLDKARNYPNTPILIGSDALIRMFDPKWGPDLETLLKEFQKLGTTFYVSGRTIDGTFVNGLDVVSTMPRNLYNSYSGLFKQVSGRWDISSTDLRQKK